MTWSRVTSPLAWATRQLLQLLREGLAVAAEQHHHAAARILPRSANFAARNSSSIIFGQIALAVGIAADRDRGLGLSQALRSGDSGRRSPAR